MDPEDVFRFHCYPEVSCFIQCCQDVNIFLTPYDVLRLKRGLGISSDEFIDKYTLIIPKEKRLLPLVILKMAEDKRCPFVSGKGCLVYNDRPWSCRMYPLDMSDDGTFNPMTNPDRCKGLLEKDEWRIGAWLVEQGIVPYDQMNALFSQITKPLQAQESEIENLKIAKMINSLSLKRP
ncbi:MAG: YkgJ family cysteine cluster protein [Pseudomonadota bacterium]